MARKVKKSTRKKLSAAAKAQYRCHGQFAKPGPCPRKRTTSASTRAKLSAAAKARPRVNGRFA